MKSPKTRIPRERTSLLAWFFFAFKGSDIDANSKAGKVRAEYSRGNESD